jgi:tRNA(adenine34) deaminase
MEGAAGRMPDDAEYMRRCAMLGREAGARGESPVGSVIVRDEQVVAEAMEANRARNDVTCHAEIEAIRGAVRRLKTSDLSDCVLYSTHEPCIMCSYAIRFHRIGKVVYAHAVPYLGGVSSAMPLLKATDVPPAWGKAPVVVHLDETQIR